MEALDRFEAVLSALRQAVHETVQTKAAGGKLEEQLTQGAATLVELKAVSRKTHVSIDSCRQQVSKCKTEMDSYNLQLQNLQYERDHLLREIQLCKDFTTRELDRMEEEERRVILDKSGSHLSQEKHQTNLDTLEEEMKQREITQKSLLGMRSRADEQAERNQEDAAFVEGLPDRIAKVRACASPLEKFLGPCAGERRDARAMDLPAPLYVLYCQLEAYCHTWGTGGSEVAATAAVCISEVQQAQGDEQPRKRQKKTGAGGGEEQAWEGPTDEDLTSLSPLAVDLALEFPEHPDAPALSVRFQYMPVLKVVAVSAPASFPNLLVNLFPDDTGADTPNLANYFAGLDKFPSDMTARPYKWAQWLAGLCFRDSSTIGHEHYRRIVPSTRAVVSRLAHRAVSLMALESQLVELAALKIPVGPHLERASAEMGNSSLTFTTWKEVPAPASGLGTEAKEGGATLSKSQRRAPQELARCRYFKGVVATPLANTQVNVLVQLSPEYPLLAPLIQLRTQGGHESNDVRWIETEVNAYWGDLLREDHASSASWDYVLSFQLQRLMACLASLSKGDDGAAGRRRGRGRRKVIEFNGPARQLSVVK